MTTATLTPLDASPYDAFRDTLDWLEDEKKVDLGNGGFNRRHATFRSVLNNEVNGKDSSYRTAITAALEGLPAHVLEDALKKFEEQLNHPTTQEPKSKPNFGQNLWASVTESFKTLFTNRTI